MEIYCGCSIASLHPGTIRISTHNICFKEKKRKLCLARKYPHGFLLLLTGDHVQYTNLSSYHVEVGISDIFKGDGLGVDLNLKKSSFQGKALKLCIRDMVDYALHIRWFN